VTAARPRIRDPVGQGARLLATLLRVLPDRWLDAIRIRLSACLGEAPARCEEMS
jgi:hypothetical protein